MSGSKEFGEGFNFPPSSPPSSKPILVWDPENPASFLELVDTINSYTGHAGKFLVVKSTEDGVTVSTASVETDKYHAHIQGTPAVTWNISHALAKFPSVTVVDATGHEIMADVEYISSSSIKINFVNATAGTAYLN